jgi:hypothetical protein
MSCNLLDPIDLHGDDAYQTRALARSKSEEPTNDRPCKLRRRSRRVPGRRSTLAACKRGTQVFASRSVELEHYSIRPWEKTSAAGLALILLASSTASGQQASGVTAVRGRTRVTADRREQTLSAQLLLLFSLCIGKRIYNRPCGLNTRDPWRCTPRRARRT